MTNSFENILLEDSSIDANALHLANIALKEIFLIKEIFQISICKYISQLIFIAKYFLIENIILKFELKNLKELLNKRKS